MHCNCHSLVHRALVTYADERTGEIRVRVPAVTGLGEMSISKIARTKHNNVWVVPTINSQILVSADDENMTNLFWLHSDVEEQSSHFRNYFEAFSTDPQVAQVVSGRGVTLNISYNNIVFNEGIRLVDGTKITFDYEGTYELKYSLQMQNTDSQAKSTGVWFSYNDLDYPNSTRIFSVPSKHGFANGTIGITGNFIGKAFVGDFIELHWASESTTVSMVSIPAGVYPTLPVTTPRSPSVLVTVTQVA